MFGEQFVQHSVDIAAGPTSEFNGDEGEGTKQPFYGGDPRCALRHAVLKPKNQTPLPLKGDVCAFHSHQ